MFYTLRDHRVFAALLDEKGWSTRALAAQLSDTRFSVSHQRIGQLRVGAYPNVDSKLARHIEKTLNVPRGHLFKGARTRRDAS